MNQIIAVDFDGTIVEHRFPDIGKPVPGAIEWLLKFQETGCRLILWTIRDDRHIPFLADALEFCRERGLEFWGANKNPEQPQWSGSPKAYAHIYIDDAAFGCPVIPDSEGKRFMVDWEAVGPQVWSLIFIEGEDVVT